MALDEQTGGHEANGNGTPSTASRVKGVAVESVFTTPTPRRDISKDSTSGRRSPAPPIPFIFVPKSSPAPRQHKSVEVLGTNARINSSVMSAASDLEKQFLQKEISKKNSQHFDQAFAVRESYHSAKSRIYGDSMIVLELQLNRCVSLMTLSEIWLTLLDRSMISKASSPILCRMFPRPITDHSTPSWPPSIPTLRS